jgi:ribosomal protein S18 acetylase RimI-like enzyme
MQIKYRDGLKKDSKQIAELIYIASGGAIEFLFHDLVPNLSPTQIVAHNLENDYYPHSYKSAIVAEYNEDIIGVSLSYPSHFHKITDEMKKFLPKERIEHFKHFYSARVEKSLLIDALCVHEKYRRKGIGSELIDLTKKKAEEIGYDTLSLIVFADNLTALQFYRNNGFEIIEKIELKPHELIPHKGGCLLMKCTI